MFEEQLPAKATGGGPDKERKERKRKDSRLVRDSKKYSEQLERRGVVFIARVPPHMKPNKMQSLFEAYGRVTRLFLQEEDATVAKRRKAAGGNGSRQFREGWIEFEDMKLARRIAESLNNTPIGGKKSSFYHDDLWNLKYLKGFTWDNLTEMQACAKRASEAKLQAAMLQSKRQNAEFSELVEKNEIHKRVQQRKRSRGQEDDSAPAATSSSEETTRGSKARKFRQVQSISSAPGEDFVDKSLLKRVFAAK